MLVTIKLKCNLLPEDIKRHGLKQKKPSFLTASILINDYFILPFSLPSSLLSFLP